VAIMHISLRNNPAAFHNLDSEYQSINILKVTIVEKEAQLRIPLCEERTYPREASKISCLSNKVCH